MTKTVDQIIDELIGREGGYSDHPSDRGGPTRWGVTEQVARAYGYQGNMNVFPRAAAIEIYRKRYWEEPGFARVAEIFPDAAIELFDTGVNMGQAVAARFLQRSLNCLNRGGAGWPDIKVDGAIGTMTLDACKRFKAQRGALSQAVLLRCLNGLQLARYVEITEARAANEDFFFGWVANRIGAVS